MIIGLHDVLEDGYISLVQLRLVARQWDWISEHFPLLAAHIRAQKPHLLGCTDLDLDYLLAWLHAYVCMYTHICKYAEGVCLNIHNAHKWARRYIMQLMQPH